MNLEQIVKAALIKNGFTGLCNDECGCDINDLMPCGEPQIDCEAGYKIQCPPPEDCFCKSHYGSHIVPTKPT